MYRVLIIATVGSIAVWGAPVRAQVETREMPMPSIGRIVSAPLHETLTAAVIETPDDLAAVREQYRAAAASRDAAAIIDLFAEDGVLVASDRDVVRGRDDLGKYYANAFEQAMPDVTLTCISTENRNGFGSETGRFEERVTNAEGTVTSVTGVYVTIYRRDAAGRWRVAIEIRSRGGQQPLGVW
jgi:uncharacterized protein (TIGR02246 family)